MGFVEVQSGVRYCTRCRAVYHSDFVRCPNDGGELQLAVDDPLVGTPVAHYVVDAFIGGGAMGRVYRCHHHHLQHKQFALKVLRGDLAATMSMRLRFTQEAEAASRLVHPNVVSVLDFGRTDEGLLFITMELVEGASLGELIQRTPMAIPRVLGLARQLCLGLAHAHDHHLVHRDFKPDNILVISDGATEVPRIVDFGLAISAGPDGDGARFTTAGLAVGTPVYASPEQMRDHPDVDHRADLFALGVTMFEMLAGRLPFEASLLETLHLNATAERPTIAARAPNVVVPARLERLVHRLMAIDPADRPASARDVYDELGVIELEVANGTAVPVTPPVFDRAGSTDRVRRPSSRFVRGLAIGVISAAAVAVVWFVALRTSDGARDRPEMTTASISTLPRPAPIVRPSVTPIDPPIVPPVVAMSVPADPPPAKPIVTSRHLPVAVRKHPAVHVAPPGPIAVERVADTAKPEGEAVTRTDPPAADPPRVDPPTQPPVVASPRSPPPQPIKPVVTKARLSLADLSVRGSLTAAIVRRAVERVMPVVGACYGPAALRAGRSPAVDVRMRFEIDESQRARSIQPGPTALPGLADCVVRALGGVTTETPPDVGTEDVTFLFQFAPEGS